MKQNFSFENYYVRNVFAYLVVLFIGTVPFLMEAKYASSKIIIQNIEYFTLSFLIVLFHNRILLQKLLFKRKVILYIISLIPTYFLFYYGTWLIMNKAMAHSDQVLFFIVEIALGFAIFLATKYILERKQFFQTTLMKRDAELLQLKSQLNPHFLFNALNNIYSYTLHSDKFGNELILKLSDLMRYILDSENKNAVPLLNEINFIENYIAFEKERLGNRCEILYSKNILYENRCIEPLILFPFIENAFKHGADTIQKTVVQMQLSDTAETLRLIVKNKIIHKNKQSTKIGLANARRRLELLYPAKHELRIETMDDIFIIDLTLQYG